MSILFSEQVYSSRPTDACEPGDRGYLLANVILPAVWDVTESKFTRKHFIHAKHTLDVSCGRGGLAVAARHLRSNSRYIGIDIYNYERNPEIATAYNEYEEVRVGSVRSQSMGEWMNQWSFDLIMAICTHPDVYSYLAKNVETLPLNLGGRVVFIAEVSLDGIEDHGFDRFVGRGYGYQIGVSIKE